uniref:Uncharacterized protein n=1 Tax=Romanomermis culicivorax TaxID=13658 RepID=A0A915I5G3_ROMCU
RSPLYSHISATLNGLISIRAYSCQNDIVRKNDISRLNTIHFEMVDAAVGVLVNIALLEIRKSTSTILK